MSAPRPRTRCFRLSPLSLVGLLLLMCGRVAQTIDLSHASIFASGALLTASLMHIIPEALEGLQSKYDDNLHDLGIHAGLALLIGVTFGVVVHALLTSSHSHSHTHGGYAQDGHEKTKAEYSSEAPVSSTFTPVAAGATAPVGKSGAGTLGGVTQSGSSQTLTEIVPGASVTESIAGSTVTLETLINDRSGKKLLDVGSLQSVCWTVIIGDLVHNFADGVTIGAAFLGCSSTIGWTVTASAIVHEVPHELADFMALIKGGMSAYQVNTARHARRKNTPWDESQSQLSKKPRRGTNNEEWRFSEDLVEIFPRSVSRRVRVCILSVVEKIGYEIGSRGGVILLMVSCACVSYGM